MTAEIALLNKSAVALAADSAMTLSGTGKIYQTNKLFELSRYHPVGIMIYNGGEFMGVPWETIIKKYRLSIGKKSKPKVRDYLKDFLKYLQNSGICTDEQEKKELLQAAYRNYLLILDKSQQYIRDTFKKKKSVSTGEAKQAMGKAIKDRLRYLEQWDKADSIKDMDISKIIAYYQADVSEMINQAFEDFGISDSEKKMLYRVFEMSIKSIAPSSINSGIVVAGFGEDEVFPALIEVVICGTVEGKLKYNIRRCTEINFDGTFAAIVPFAQAEMVHRFMQGVDPEYLDYINSATIELLCQFGTELLGVHKISTPEIWRNVRRAAENMVEKRFNPAAADFRQTHFVNPVMKIVEHLPKEEFSSMAEALVNLTSVKRRVSLEQETVGGPIDIAVISKGDGFVWTKRKHYFDNALNPSYLHRRTPRSSGGGADDSWVRENSQEQRMGAASPSGSD